MSNNFRERSPRSSELPDLPNEVRFNIFKHLDTLEDWKNYSEVYSRLKTDDYFWKKLIIKFPELTIETCRYMNWAEAIQRVDFNFTLIHAYETDDIQLARQVFYYGGNVYQYYEGKWLFFTITLERKFDMALLFLNKGFNINAVNNKQTVLMYCVLYNNIECVKFLLEHGADVNVNVDTYCSSALITFCYNYYSFANDAMLTLLTDHGADYNLKNRLNEVALHLLIDGLGHILARQPIYDVKRIFSLFVLKTDMTIVRYYNETFLHGLCIEYIFDEINEEFVALYEFIITLFLDAGVPINAQDGLGKTAYDHVINNPICQFLRQHGGLSQDELQ